MIFFEGLLIFFIVVVIISVVAMCYYENQLIKSENALKEQVNEYIMQLSILERAIEMDKDKGEE